MQELDTLLDGAGPRTLIAIDIPIGLPIEEPRACDKEARNLLGWPRRTGVFSPPARLALGARNYREALCLNRNALGVGISMQAFCIMPKIREVDAVMNRDRQRYVPEVHPEVTFTQLNGAPMFHNKKTAAGRAGRIAVLNRFIPLVTDEWLVRQRSSLPRIASAAPDDLVDALACLVTASHIHKGCGQRLGGIQRDDKKLLMEIVTCAKPATA
jgi:predicted RNase H-like nuclease